MSLLLIQVLTLVTLGAPPRAPGITQPGDTVSVPEGTPPVLDGRVDAAEWADATTVPLRGGGAVLLKRGGDDLFLAIRSTHGGFASVGWLSADTLRILHASTGLISSVYQPGPAGWRRTRPFRGPLMPDGSEFPRGPARRSTEYREASYRQWGWTATVVELGPPQEMEYRVRLPQGPSVRLAVAFRQVKGSPPTAVHPVHLADGSLNPELLQGTAPPVLDFRPTTWTTLIWARPGSALPSRLEPEDVLHTQAEGPGDPERQGE